MLDGGAALPAAARRHRRAGWQAGGACAALRSRWSAARAAVQPCCIRCTARTRDGWRAALAEALTLEPVAARARRGASSDDHAHLLVVTFARRRCCRADRRACAVCALRVPKPAADICGAAAGSAAAVAVCPARCAGPMLRRRRVGGLRRGLWRAAVAARPPCGPVPAKPRYCNDGACARMGPLLIRPGYCCRRHKPATSFWRGARRSVFPIQTLSEAQPPPPQITQFLNL